MGEFLGERDFIGWSAPEGFPASLAPAGLFTQDAPNGLEVALAESPRKPTAPDLRRAWSKRRAGRASPVLVVARYPTAEGERVSLCGPAGDQPIVQHGVEVSQAERLAGVALDEPNRHAATRFLLAHLPELDQPMPGLRNVGLLSTQELEAGVPQRSDWPEAARRARRLLGRRGRPLAEGLGFGVNPLSTNTSVLLQCSGTLRPRVATNAAAGRLPGRCFNVVGTFLRSPDTWPEPTCGGTRRTFNAVEALRLCVVKWRFAVAALDVRALPRGITPNRAARRHRLAAGATRWTPAGGTSRTPVLCFRDPRLRP